MQSPILRNFRKVVTSKFISEAAQKVVFNKRSTAQISGLDFTRMLIMQSGSGREINYSNLNETISKLNRNVSISNQALSEYLCKDSSVKLLKSIYEKIFTFQKQALSQKCSKNIDQRLEVFNRILLQDSTFCVLHNNLALIYKGSGGSASKASLKIDVIHELKTSSVIKLTILPGNVPDASLAKLLLDELLPGDLILRDLGYFKMGELNEIANENAYFISRYKSPVTVRISDNSVDLGRYLNATYDRFPNQIIDVDVHLGPKALGARLIAYKIPPEVAATRRRKVKREAVCQGSTCSEGRLNLCDFIILITNIPRDLIEADIIGTIYRIRWQIELIFKTWKSQLNLQNNLEFRKQNCILCIMYTTLIVCLLTIMIHGWLKKMVDPLGKEISLDKLTKWLVNKQGYFTLFIGSIEKLEIEIQRDLRKIRMQKRKRKTTIERVNCSESYGEKYVVNF